ncbi:lysR substrate binding domain protein, partial [Vibrio parahaemolyticus V-223/04]
MSLLMPLRRQTYCFLVQST